MLLQFFHVQNTIKDQPLQLPEGHTNINTWGTLVDDWWTFSLICFTSHRSGSKWLSSSSFFSSLCSSFASKKLLSKDRRPSKSCDSSWRRVLSDEYLYMALHSFSVIWDFTFLCSSGLSFLQLRRSSNVCSWKENWEIEPLITFRPQTIEQLLYLVKKLVSLTAENPVGLFCYWRIWEISWSIWWKDRPVKFWSALLNYAGSDWVG